MKKLSLILLSLIFCSSLVLSQTSKKKIQQHVLIHLKNIPNEEERAKLETEGIFLESYVSGTTYYATIKTDVQSARKGSKKTFAKLVLGVEPILSKHKMDDYLASGNIPDYALEEEGVVKVIVKYFIWADETTIISDIEKLRLTKVNIMEEFNLLTLNLPMSLLTKFTTLDWVKYVECSPPPYEFENYNSRALIKSNILHQQGIGKRGLSGKGLNVGIWDGNIYNHPDLGKRLHSQEAVKASEHGQHVSGTMAGAGLIDPYGKGMAFDAEVYAYNFTGGFTPIEMLESVRKYGVTITQNSYGLPNKNYCQNPKKYDNTDNATDLLVNWFPKLLHVYAAGNDQQNCGNVSRFATSTKRVKNAIMVAAVDKLTNMSDFSSWGPMDDGRLLPHISAYGVDVYSTVYNNLYEQEFWSGTSMACPALSGLATLIYERYKQLNDTLPIAALVKAALLNTADDRGNTGPDYKFGYGIANGVRAVEIFEKEQFKTDFISHKEEKNYTISVPSGAKQLRVMLVWTDKEGTSENKALINDLDLNVTQNSKVYNPWVLDPKNPNKPATKGIDRLNNQEQVVIDNPSGTYSINVKGYLVPLKKQEYALVYSYIMPEFTLSYPTSDDKFGPGEEIVLRWEAEGTIGNTSVEISYDGGSEFVILKKNIQKEEKQVLINIPSDAPITKDAKIRIIQNGQVSISEPFTIMQRPSNLKLDPKVCSLSGWKLKWDSVNGAESYEVLKANEEEGNYSVLATVNTNSYNLPTLETGKRNIYSVIAIKEEVKSERAYAVIANPSETLTINPNKLPINESFKIYPSPLVQVEKGSNITAKYQPSPFLDAQTNVLRFDGKKGFDEVWNTENIFANVENVATASMCIDATNVSDNLWIRIAVDMKSTDKKTAGFKLMADETALTNTFGQTVVTKIEKGQNIMFWDLSSKKGTSFNLKLEVAVKDQKTDPKGNPIGDYVRFGHIKIFKGKNDLALSKLIIPEQSANLTNKEQVKVRVWNESGNNVSNFKLKLFVNDMLTATENFTKIIEPFKYQDYIFTKKIDLSIPETKYIIKTELDFEGDENLKNNTITDTTFNLGNYFTMPKKETAIVKKEVSNEEFIFTDDGAKIMNYSNSFQGAVIFETPNNSESVKITFTEFELSEDDKLTIYDGSRSSDKVLAILTGDVSREMTFISKKRTSRYNGGNLYLEFESNKKNNTKGWVAKVQSTTETPVSQYNNNSVTLSDINNTNGYFTQTQDIKITISNNTDKDINNVKARYRVDYGSWVEENISSLKVGENEFSFATKANLTAFGTYIIEAELIHNSDMYTEDNTQSKKIINEKYCIASGYQPYLENKRLLISEVAKGKTKNTTSKEHIGNTYPQNFRNIAFDVIKDMPNQVLKISINQFVENAKIGVWIDWDNNGILTDANEAIPTITCENGKTDYLLTMNVPASVNEGNYVMRIKASTGTDIDSPCTSITPYISAGEIEDYSINVSANNISKDVAVVTTNLRSGENLSNNETIKASIKNNANTEISNFDVAFKINEQAEVKETVTQNIAKGETLEYTFTTKADLSKQGENIVKIYTKLASDEVAENDSLILQIINRKPIVDGFFALDFDGIDDAVNLGNLNKTNIHTSTYEMWINPKTYGGYSSIGFGRLFEGKNATIFLCGHGSSLYPDESLIISAEGGVFYTATNTIKLNKMQHIAVSIDITAKTIKAYINGVESSLTEYKPMATTTSDNANQNLWIGNNKNGNRQFKGVIDEARVWNKVLTQTEIQNGMYVHKTGTSGLIAEFSLNEGYYNYTVKSGAISGTILNAELSEKNGIWLRNDNLLNSILVDEQVSKWTEKMGGIIEAEVKQSVNLSALKTNFEVNWPNTVVKIGTQIQQSGITTNDFTNSEITPVEYTITANLFGQVKTNTLKLSVKKEANIECDLLSLELQSPVNKIFTSIDGEMVCEVNAGTDITSVPTVFTASTGAKVFVGTSTSELTTGSNIDYTQPVVFKVVAANNRNVKYYTVCVKTKQNITWNPAPTTLNKKYGDANFDLRATVSSNNELLYISADTSIMKILNGKAIIKGVGTTNITVYQQGNNSYMPATPISKTFVVNKADLTITADDKTVDFSDPIPKLTMSFNGFKYNETQEVIDELPTISTTAKQNDVAGDYDILLTGGTDNNYNLVLTKGKLTINTVPTNTVKFVATYKGAAEADVKININNKKLTTDSNGEASILLKSQKTYNYTATKTGKEPLEGTINLANTNLTENLTIIDELPIFTISYTSDSNGKIEGEATQLIKQGKDGKEVTAVPNFGYSFEKWDDELTSATRKENNVQATKTIKALFKIKTYTLVYNTEENGTLQGELSQHITHGQDATSVKALAKDGYAFSQWSDGVKDNPRTDRTVMQNINVTAQYTKAYTLPYTQTFDLSTLPKHWSIIDHAKTNTVWMFKNKIGHSENLNDANGNYAVIEDQNRKATNADLLSPIFDLTKYSTIKIKFKHYFKKLSNSYAVLLYSIKGGDWVEIKKWQNNTQNSENFEKDMPELAGKQNVQFCWKYVAGNNWEYHWAIDDLEISGMQTAESYTYTYRTADNGYLENANEEGIITGTAKHGEKAPQIKAIANAGYIFKKWSDGVTDNPRQDVVVHPIDVIAQFQSDCSPISAIPYLEDFNTPNDMPDCWSNPESPSGYKWEVGYHDIGTEGKVAAFKGSQMNVSGGAETIDFISPTFDLSAQSDVYLSFKHYFSKFMKAEKVFVSYSIDNGTNWTKIKEWTEKFSNIDFFSEKIDAVAGKTQVKFKWTYSGAYDLGYYVDDVALDSKKTYMVFYEAEYLKVGEKWLTRGHLEGDSIQTVAEGQDATPIKAIPNEGYKFVQWSDGVTDNPRTDKAIKNNIEVTATFEAIVYYHIKFTVKNKDQEVEGATLSINNKTLTTDVKGEVTIDLASGEYDYTIKKEGFVDYSKKIKVEEKALNIDINLTKVGVKEEFAQIKIMPNPVSDKLILEGIENIQTIEIYNLTGKLNKRIEISLLKQTSIDISDFNSGVYILKLSNQKGENHLLKIVKQ